MVLAIQKDILQMIESRSKETFLFFIMIFYFLWGVMGSLFANEMGPTHGEGQACDEFFDAVCFGEMGLFEIKAIGESVPPTRQIPVGTAPVPVRMIAAPCLSWNIINSPLQKSPSSLRTRAFCVASADATSGMTPSRPSRFAPRH